MSNFWYFLGGCAAGALAMAAVQAVTERGGLHKGEKVKPHLVWGREGYGG